MLTDIDIANCSDLVAAKWSWCVYNTDTRNPKALVAWVFRSCDGFWPEPRTLNDPLSTEDSKALCSSVQYRLGVEPTRTQLIGFIPVILIYFIVDLIVQFIVAYFLNKSNFVVRAT